MTQTDVDLGRMNIEVSLAPMEPAEFVIVRIGQSTSARPTGPLLPQEMGG